jgi:hypothetical protein
MRAEQVAEFLFGYRDLLLNGWTTSADGLPDAERETWIGAVRWRLRRDRLEGDVEAVFNGFPDLPDAFSAGIPDIGRAKLRHPSGVPYPDPLFYSDAGASSRREFREAVERDWGDVLLLARRRVEAELDVAAPGWREREARLPWSQDRAYRDAAQRALDELGRLLAHPRRGESQELDVSIACTAFGRRLHALMTARGLDRLDEAGRIAYYEEELRNDRWATPERFSALAGYRRRIERQAKLAGGYSAGPAPKPAPRRRGREG